MSRQIELRFHIRAYSKATMPMSRLLEYLSDLGVILGEEHSVHLDRVEDGSAMPVLRVDEEAEPKVVANTQRARTNSAPKPIREAVKRIELRLVADNGKGAELWDHTRNFELIKFEGRGMFHEPWGPMRQEGDLTGFVIAIGGKNEPIGVKLQDGEDVHTCHAKRDIGRRLRPFLLEPTKPIRAHGYGKWLRNDQGEWHMEDFTITDFEPLDPASLMDVLTELRSVKSTWLDGPDPLGKLRKLDDV